MLLASLAGRSLAAYSVVAALAGAILVGPWAAAAGQRLHIWARYRFEPDFKVKHKDG
jgi:hypothetical protein